jgi:hypothetical protein
MACQSDAAVVVDVLVGVGTSGGHQETDEVEVVVPELIFCLVFQCVESTVF